MSCYKYHLQNSIADFLDGGKNTLHIVVNEDGLQELLEELDVTNLAAFSEEIRATQSAFDAFQAQFAPSELSDLAQLDSSTWPRFCGYPIRFFPQAPQPICLSGYYNCEAAQ